MKKQEQIENVEEELEEEPQIRQLVSYRAAWARHLAAQFRSKGL